MRRLRGEGGELWKAPLCAASMSEMALRDANEVEGLSKLTIEHATVYVRSLVTLGGSRETSS